MIEILHNGSLDIRAGRAYLDSELELPGVDIPYLVDALTLSIN